MTEVEEKLLAIRQKSLQAETKVDVQQTPIEESVGSATTTEEPAETASQSDPKEQEQTEVISEPKVETPAASWDDSTEEVPTQTTSPEIDFTSLGSALEFGEIKTKDEFVAKASELKSKLKALEEAPLAGLPDEFKEVIKVTKDGGDWRDYLAQLTVDYSKLDPVVLYEDEFFRDAERNPRYQTDGKYDHDKALTALETIPEAMRESIGKQMQFGFIQNQRQKQQEIRQRAEAKRIQADTTLTQATKNLGEILPLETYGIKFEPKHSAEIHQGITSSKLTKKHLGVSYEDLVKSGADMKSIVRTITLAEKGEKMIKFKADNSKTQAKKEILTQTQNIQLNTSGQRVNPEDPEKTVKSPAEKLKELFASQKKGL